MPDIELLNIENINCNTIGTEKEGKSANCNVSKGSILSAGSEQYCANTGLERSCSKTNSNTSCYTNRGSSSKNRPYNAFLPTVNNNEIECFLPGPNRATNTMMAIQI